MNDSRHLLSCVLSCAILPGPSLTACPATAGAAPQGEPELLFGHWCSIITSLSVTPDG